jgi:subtilisin family serine protease
VLRRLLLPLALVAAVVAVVEPIPAAATQAGANRAGSTQAGATQAGANQTGNLLVVLDRTRAGGAAAASVRAAVASVGTRLAGKSVPEIGLITVRPLRWFPLAAAARALRQIPGVASVQAERRYAPRSVPNDPALSSLEANGGVVQWALGAEGFYHAWDISHGDGARVGVIDTGIDAGHPDLAPQIAAAVDAQDPSVARGNARTDEAGHGTHVASLACAATDNGIGMAGAGYNCDLVIEKSDFSDSSIVAAIVDATNRGVQAINMSFGPPASSGGQASDAEVRALDYAAAHNVVLVAAASDAASAEQGDPANVLQPSGTGQDIAKGLGLDVTAAQFDGHRASFAGFGSEISMAAYGALKPGSGAILAGLGPPPGIFGAFPSNTTDLESGSPPCSCRTTFQGDNRYAYVQGTSMAAPQVAATAAMMRVLNPDASSADIIRLLKLSARRPAGVGWTPDLGWGILDAGTALEMTRRFDRLPPVSIVRAPALTSRRVFSVRWAGRDQTRPQLIPSGIDHYDVYVKVDGGRSQLLARTRRHQLRFAGRPGARYVFFTVAVDRAGNREMRPRRVLTRVARGAR